MKKITTISGNKVSVLGLGSNLKMDADCISFASQRGINYFFFYNLNSTHLIKECCKLAQNHRQDIVFATGCETRKLVQLEAYRINFCEQFGIDAIDLFFLEYISPQDDIEEIKTLLAQLLDWKKRGLIRYLGISTHNRELAVNLLNSNQIDVLMHRYNMAHRQAEKIVLPTAISTQVPVVSFTATRWGSLLLGHNYWHGKVATATDCYRFVLQHRAIHLTLTSPKTTTELEGNLAILNSIEMSKEEYNSWQNYGNLIYANGKDKFETQWL